MTDTDITAWMATTPAVAEMRRRLRHMTFMSASMNMTEAFIGVPYGPALCQTRPSALRGILNTNSTTKGGTQ